MVLRFEDAQLLAEQALEDGILIGLRCRPPAVDGAEEASESHCVALAAAPERPPWSEARRAAPTQNSWTDD